MSSRGKSCELFYQNIVCSFVVLHAIQIFLNVAKLAEFQPKPVREKYTLSLLLRAHSLSGEGSLWLILSLITHPKCDTQVSVCFLRRAHVCSEVQQTPKLVKLNLASHNLELVPLCSSGALLTSILYPNS